jgi:cell division transport system permease protein
MKIWLVQHRDALTLALHRLAASPVNTLLSLLAIGIALALPAGGQMLLANALQLARNATPTPQISLFLQLDAEPHASQELAGRLARHPGVKSLRLIPRDETLARVRASEDLGDIVDALPRNPFPDAITVRPVDDGPEAMERLAGEFRKLAKVEHVQLDSAWVRRLDALLRIGRTGVVLLALLLGVGLVAITFNTIRLQVMTCRAEIELSRLLGATDAFIRRPFLYFGILLGLAGGCIAWLIVAGAALWLKSPIGELAALYSLDFGLRPLDAIDSTALLGAAALLGWLGASLSLRQHLRDA